MPTQQMLSGIAKALTLHWAQDETSIFSDFSNFTVSPLKGRGSTSTCYQLQVADEQGNCHRFFVKKYMANIAEGHNQLETDFRTAKWLAAELGDHSVLRVVPPVLKIPEERILVASYVTGRNLSPYFSKKLRWRYLLKNDASELKNIAGRIGAGLAELQSIPAVKVSEFFDNREPQRFFTRLKTELNKYMFFYAERKICYPLVKHIAKSIGTCLDEYQAQGASYCFQHNDYILQNFVIDERGRLQLFDFANSTLGIPCFDLAHMLNSFEDLTYLKSVSTSFIEQLKKEFLDRFSSGATYQSRVLAAMRAYIQLYSGTILLSGSRLRQRDFYSPIIRVNPAKRMEEKLSFLLEELEL